MKIININVIWFASKVYGRNGFGSDTFQLLCNQQQYKL